MTQYAITYSHQASRFLRNVDKGDADRFFKKIEQVAQDPFRYLEHFEGSGHKLRVGKLRALIDVDQQTMMLLVRVLDTRGRIYK